MLEEVRTEQRGEQIYLEETHKKLFVRDDTDVSRKQLCLHNRREKLETKQMVS